VCGCVGAWVWVRGCVGGVWVSSFVLGVGVGVGVDVREGVLSVSF